MSLRLFATPLKWQAFTPRSGSRPLPTAADQGTVQGRQSAPSMLATTYYRLSA
jgi:hypothetical protein